MNVDMRTKVLIWFWYLESIGCINETTKATRYVQYRLTFEYTQNTHPYTHTEHTSTTSPLNETQD
jgi:hypothetical protein